MPPPASARSPSRRALLRPLPALAAVMLTGPLMPRGARALMAGLPPDTPQRRELPNDIDSPWSGVGAVLVDGHVYSGSLIDHRHVLTAAHVVAGRSASRIRFQLNAGAASTILASDTVIVHPNYQGFATDANDPSAMPAYDVAIIRLDRPAPAAVATYPPFFGSLRAGTVLTLVGYGMSGHGHEGPSVPARADVRRIGGNVLDQFLPLPDQPGTAGFFLYDFDPPPGGPRRDGAAGPGRDDRNRMGGPSLGNPVETLVAAGDSGAPAFIVRGRYRALIGVLTFAATATPGGKAAAEGRTPREPLSRFGGIGGGILLGPLQRWIESVQQAR